MRVTSDSSDTTPLKSSDYKNNKCSLSKFFGALFATLAIIAFVIMITVNLNQTSKNSGISTLKLVGLKTDDNENQTTIMGKEMIVSNNQMFADAQGAEFSGLQNSGRDCWGGCNRKQGPCTWCGNGYCCRRNWKGNGCDGKIGGPNNHQCVNAPSGLKNSGRDCWGGCNRKQGPCSWCGNGYCCRRNWKGNGCDGKIGGPSNHQCVNAPEINLETCNLMNDMDLPGYDIHCKSVANNSQECANRCYKNNSCKTFTFIPDGWKGRRGALCCEKRRDYVESWRRINSGLVSGTRNCGDSRNQEHSESERGVTAGPACWIHSYGRGAGYVLSECASNQEKNGALCYPRCKSGYYGVGPVCWQRCPSGWTDGGVFCHIPVHTTGANNRGCPWYDKCGLTFRKGCSKCPSGYANHGCLCTRHARHFTKKSYGRGAGKPLICRSELERSGALCYPRCKKGYKGIGPVCWNKCPPSHPYECGPLMCTLTGKECAGKLLALGDALLRNQDSGALRLLGIASALCIPVCGDQEHMICTVLNHINAAFSICPLDLSKCAEGAKCLKFLNKRAEVLANGAARLLSGGTLKDFNSFFANEGGLSRCVKQASSWFNRKGDGCKVQKDGTFKQFTSCIFPVFQGFFIDDFSSPSLYISVGGGGNLGIVGGSTTLDVNFVIDGTIIFSYTTCNTLTTPDLSAGVSISVGINGNKNEIGGGGVSIGIGASIPGTDIGAGAEVGYSEDGEHVTSIGANFGIGAGLDLIPATASCSICNTRILGCVTTLEEMGLEYLMP